MEPDLTTETVDAIKRRMEELGIDEKELAWRMRTDRKHLVASLLESPPTSLKLIDRAARALGLRVVMRLDRVDDQAEAVS